MAKLPVDTHYRAFLTEIKEKVYQAQYQAMKQVNMALIGLYWEIGQGIVERQQQYKWGKSIVENLSVDLQKEFPGVDGLSSRNLWLMRKFYKEYSGNEKLQPMVAEIGWTKSVLIHHIESGSYERFLTGQTNFDMVPIKNPPSLNPLQQQVPG